MKDLKVCDKHTVSFFAGKDCDICNPMRNAAPELYDALGAFMRLDFVNCTDAEWAVATDKATDALNHANGDDL